MRFMYNTSVCINNPKLFLTIPLGKTSSYCTSFSQYKVIPLYEQDKMNIRKYMEYSNLTLCTKREYLDKSSLCQIGNVFCCRITSSYHNTSKLRRFMVYIVLRCKQVQLYFQGTKIPFIQSLILKNYKLTALYTYDIQFIYK